MGYRFAVERYPVLEECCPELLECSPDVRGTLSR